MSIACADNMPALAAEHGRQKFEDSRIVINYQKVLRTHYVSTRNYDRGFSLSCTAV